MVQLMPSSIACLFEVVVLAGASKDLDYLGEP
jgi:hypothetical protein